MQETQAWRPQVLSRPGCLPSREAWLICRYCRESEGQHGGWLMFQKDSRSRPKKGAGQGSLGSRTLGTKVEGSDKDEEEGPGGGPRGSL